MLLNNILCERVNWIEHILRRNSLLYDTRKKQMMDLKSMEMIMQLLDDVRKKKFFAAKGGS